MNLKSFTLLIIFFIILTLKSEGITNDYNMEYLININSTKIKIVPIYVNNAKHSRSIYRDYIFGIKIEKVYVNKKAIKPKASLVAFDDLDNSKINIKANQDYIYYINIRQLTLSEENLMGKIFSYDKIVYEYRIPKLIKNLKIYYKFRYPDNSLSSMNVCEINFN